MGASPSKVGEVSSDKQAWTVKADAPVRFSDGLTRSLQESSQTDSTRNKNLELLIQSRVTEELEKRLQASTEKLSTASEDVSNAPDPKPKRVRINKPGPSLTEKPLLNRLVERVTGNSSDEYEYEEEKSLDRSAVSKEIDELKRKLDRTKKVSEPDAELAKAKSEVIACLKANDSRPLDCWKEVENFKFEVGRLEQAFIQKTGS